jgi:ketosteroid isomerase-like protein
VLEDDVTAVANAKQAHIAGRLQGSRFVHGAEVQKRQARVESTMAELTRLVGRQKQVVERYFDGFRASDHAAILALLTDDVEWDIAGFKNLRGKEAFDSEIENENFVGSPRLNLDRLVEEGDTVVAIGTGDGRLRTGEPFRFAFCTVFTFQGDLIGRVESHVIPLK